MKIKAQFCVLVICSMLLFPGIAVSEILFQDNFDSHANWSPHPASNDAGSTGATAECNQGDCTGQVLDGWSYFRSTGLWWGPTYQDTIRVSGEQFRGVNGKAYIQWNESNNGASGDGWGADGVLAKDLGADYKTLYIEFYIKLSPQWQWPANLGPGVFGQAKIFRVFHYDGSGNVFQFFSNGHAGPIYIFDILESMWGWRHSHAYRCAPQETDYYCPNSSPGSENFTFPGKPNFNDLGQLGDGNWHKLNFQIRMNTFSNNTWNADGILRVWLDDNLIHEVTTKQWVAAGSDQNIGWNVVGIGGNAYNTYADPAVAKKEQWYAIDDIVISTDGQVVGNPNPSLIDVEFK